tara:strand:- start:483 stop:1253 length:771 start_codon:yes stop_codon:yes gene_type:complete
VCAPDPNAGRREAARIENNRRHAEFRADSIKQWNKESSFKDNIQTIRGLGKSRDLADFQEFSNQAQGKALLGKEQLAREFFKSKAVNEGGKSRRFGGRKASEYFSKIADIDRKMFNLATVGEAKVQTKIQRRQDAMIKREHANLGMGPQFGMPTMLPPKDRAGQLMNSISFGMNVASGMMALFPSDYRLKRDMKLLGKSLEGHNIYKFKYHDDNREFVGVTAQEVLTKKPKAVVKLNTGYYAVDYSQIDVDFKEVA